MMPSMPANSRRPASTARQISGNVTKASPITPTSTCGSQAIISRGSEVSTPPPSTISARGQAARAMRTIDLIEP